MRSDDEIKAAFLHDGWSVVNQVSFQGQRGFCAEHQTARNYVSGKPKRAYYIEGSARELGYLTGLMAPDDVELMARDYMRHVIPAMVDPGLEHHKWLCEAIVAFLEMMSSEVRHKHPEDIPAIYIDEMHGLVEGCKAANPDTSVTFDKLWTLNTCIDLLLANFYTGLGTSALGRYLKHHVPGFKPSDVGTPLFCNGFAAKGAATRSGEDFYFSRNFMLTDAGVFQFTAGMTIYAPTDTFDAKPPNAFVSVAAPGFVGSVTAMGDSGVGIGVDIVPAANCSTDRPGFNSLLLVRHAVQYGTSATSSRQLIEDAQRGVSWIYIIGDGAQDDALVVEAGKKTDDLDPAQYTPTALKNLLPDSAYLQAHPSGAYQSQGLASRPMGWGFPPCYLDFNPALFEKYGKHYNASSDFIDQDWQQTNCPKTYYFAPMRVEDPCLLATTNMYMIPEMRLCMMNEVTVALSEKPLAYMTAKTNYDDIQWRYDELADQLKQHHGELDMESARQVSSFLAPGGEFSHYYDLNEKSPDGKTEVIDGCVSVCDLKRRVISSHYGYYLDPWVELSLPNYFKE